MYLGTYRTTMRHTDDHALVAQNPTVEALPTPAVARGLSRLAKGLGSMLKPRVVTVEKVVEVPVETVVEKIVEKRVEVPVRAQAPAERDSVFFDDESIHALLDEEASARVEQPEEALR